MSRAILACMMDRVKEPTVSTDETHDESLASAGAPWEMQSAPAAETVLNGRRYLYFAGTGYLGLQAHPALATAAQGAIARYGVHSATTRTGFGNSPLVVEVERRAAEFLGADEAMYLVSGYAGNFALAAALSPHVDVVLIDEAAHDCLRESLRWFEDLKCPPLVFRHLDAGHAQELLQANMRAGYRPALLSDGIVPSSGRLAPLTDYLKLLGRYEGASLLVDDAHGVASVGRQGRGCLELAGVASDAINRDFDETVSMPARVFLSTTLSKAVGGHGGAIPGSDKFLRRVRSASGWFRGASAPAAAVAAATAKGLELVQTQPQLRQQLADNVHYARTALAGLSLDVEQSPSPVISVCLESSDRMAAVQRRLLDAGIAIAFARDYAGAGPRGLLRIAVFSTHTPAMIDTLVAALAQALESSR